MSFPCTSCGACCRRVGNIPHFPEPVKDDGSCVHLRKDNKCDIYAIRPSMCRIDEMISKEPEETHAQLYIVTVKLCNQFQEEDGMPESYRVK